MINNNIKKNIKLLLCFMFMFFCVGIKEVMAETKNYVSSYYTDDPEVKIVVYWDNENGINSVNVNYTLPGFDPVTDEDVLKTKLEDYYAKNKSLPSNIYFTTFFNTGLIFKPHGIEWYESKCNKCYETSNIFTAETDENGNIISKGDPTNPTQKFDCGSLIGEKTQKFIDDILKILRIIVPILIIGLGILDFTKATFASDDNEMKKAQGKFIKRLIVGVVFFFLPIIITTLISIANQIWSDFNTCGM